MVLAQSNLPFPTISARRPYWSRSSRPMVCRQWTLAALPILLPRFENLVKLEIKLTSKGMLTARQKEQAGNKSETKNAQPHLERDARLPK